MKEKTFGKFAVIISPIQWIIFGVVNSEPIYGQNLNINFPIGYKSITTKIPILKIYNDTEGINK